MCVHNFLLTPQSPISILFLTIYIDYGMAHIVVFDTETDFGNGLVGPEELGGASGLDNGPFGTTANEQIEFLKKDLAGVDRRVTRACCCFPLSRLCCYSSYQARVR